MEDLILENQNLIYSLAKYFEGYSNKEDLFQAGCIGIIMAYKNYKPNMNTKFTTYAYSYILGEMKKLVTEDKGVKVSRNIQRLNYKIVSAKSILAQKLMHEPSIAELSEFLKIPSDIICEAINSTQRIYSIDEPINDDSMTLQEKLTIVDTMNIDDLIQLRQELSNLSVFEKELINNRYVNDMTQQETAEKMGISQVKVSRGEQKILTKLKSKLLVN